MKANELITKIRKHRGKLYAPVHSQHDVMHVAVEKQDLILRLERFGTEECGYELYVLDDNETWVFGVDHNAT